MRVKCPECGRWVHTTAVRVECKCGASIILRRLEISCRGEVVTTNYFDPWG